jgi:hypothetical protein
MNESEKCQECIITILEIAELYDLYPNVLIEHENSLLNKKEVYKIIHALANKDDATDYYFFVSKIKRELQTFSDSKNENEDEDLE